MRQTKAPEGWRSPKRWRADLGVPRSGGDRGMRGAGNASCWPCAAGYILENMKTVTTLRLAVLLGAVVFGLNASAGEPTAFDLIKEGNRYIGEQAKDKVVQIRSEKSVGSLTPNIWYIVYYDPTATLKATEVKFGAGKMMKVTRPLRLLEPVTGGDVALDRSKLKVDSDRAIKTATDEPLLKGLKLTASQPKLEHIGEGVLGVSGSGEAVWKIKLWAEKVRRPDQDVDVGEVWVSANDGKVVKNDLHTERAG